MAINQSIREAVQQRAENRCEYCHLPSGVVPGRFHVEHVIAKQHRGENLPLNLALSCARCNRHKGPNLAGIDPLDGKQVFLFNPRTMRWGEHFRRTGATIVGTTPIGRATAETLAMNNRDRVLLRTLLIDEGKITPEERD